MYDMIAIQHLLTILPKISLFSFLAFDLFQIFKRHFKPDITTIANIFVAMIVIVFVWIISNYGFDMTFQLFKDHNLETVGYIIGAFIIPIVRNIVKSIINRFIKNSKAKVTTKYSINTLLSLVVYPIASFTSFFFVYLLVISLYR